MSNEVNVNDLVAFVEKVTAALREEGLAPGCGVMKGASWRFQSPEVRAAFASLAEAIREASHASWRAGYEAGREDGLALGGYREVINQLKRSLAA